MRDQVVRWERKGVKVAGIFPKEDMTQKDIIGSCNVCNICALMNFIITQNFVAYTIVFIQTHI